LTHKGYLAQWQTRILLPWGRLAFSDEQLKAADGAEAGIWLTN
jgi:hypothetical protein